VTFKDGSTKTIDNPADFPDPGGLLKVVEILEPMIRCTIVAPDEFVPSFPSLALPY
jgi:translation elongation factor EF-4